MDVITAFIPASASSGLFTLFAEGDFVRISDTGEGHSIEFNGGSVLLLFFHFPNHRRLYVTCDPEKLEGRFVHRFDNLDTERSVLVQLRGRKFDRMKQSVEYLKKLSEGRCFRYSLLFWTQLIYLIQQGKNSRFNLNTLASRYDSAYTQAVQFHAEGKLRAENKLRSEKEVQWTQ
jgi:hypothetical protein